MKIKTVVLAFVLIFAGSTAFSASTYYIPHMAVGSFGGGTFSTTFVFFNNQSTATNVELSLTGDDGAPLSVTIPGMGTDSSFSFALEGGATKIIQTDSSGDLKAGAATVMSDGPIGVSGIYSEYDNDDEFITEVGVENSRLLNNFVIPVQISGTTVNTGLALFNPGTSDAEITATLINEDGTSAGNVGLILPAGRHMAAYLTSQNMFGDEITSLNGMLSVESDVPISAVTLRQTTSSAIDYYTSCPVVSTSSTKSVFYVPHVADGPLYKTTFMLFSFSEGTANVTLKLTGDDGTPFPVTFTGVTETTNSDTYTFTLQNGQSKFLKTDGSGSGTAAAVILSQDTAGNDAYPGGPTVPIGVAAFYTQYDSEENFETEVGVLDSPALPSFTLPIDSQVPEGSIEFDTAFALFNPGEAPVTVTPMFYDADGVGTAAENAITLEANGHFATYFSQLFPGLGSVQGSLVIAPENAVLSALTLRNNWAPVGWTSLPATSGAFQTMGDTVIRDGVASSNAQIAATSLSAYHTTGTGPNPLTLVGLSWNDNTTTFVVDSLTFTPDGGGDPIDLTEVKTQQATSVRYAAIYSLTDPPVGQSGTLTVTFTGEVPSGVQIGAVNFANVDQTTPLGTPAGAGGNSTTPTVTLSGLNGNELIMDMVFKGASASNTETMTPGADQTKVWTNWGGNSRGVASILQATSSSVTMSWTAASSAQWAIAAVPINPAP
jgi:hypothetical protein